MVKNNYSILCYKTKQSQSAASLQSSCHAEYAVLFDLVALGTVVNFDHQLGVLNKDSL